MFRAPLTGRSGSIDSRLALIACVHVWQGLRLKWRDAIVATTHVSVAPPRRAGLCPGLRDAPDARHDRCSRNTRTECLGATDIANALRIVWIGVRHVLEPWRAQSTATGGPVA
jgi:hypothetical protein